MSGYVFVFFFQAEDGIRDFHVTGVQTCALPILAFDWSGNSDRALTAARRATELDPKLPEGWAYVGEAEADKFRLQEASDALSRAAAAAPDNPEVLRVKAYLAETNADY